MEIIKCIVEVFIIPALKDTKRSEPVPPEQRPSITAGVEHMKVPTLRLNSFKITFIRLRFYCIVTSTSNTPISILVLFVLLELF